MPKSQDQIKAAQKARSRRHYLANSKLYKDRAKQWKADNAERAKATAKAWVETNIDKVRSTKARWKLRHPEQCRLGNLRRMSRRNKERRRNDPKFKVAELCRGKINKAILCFAKGGTRKNASTEALTGCSFGELVVWLSGQFRPGMTWENHGTKGWHIDHIKPCCQFDLTDPLQQRQCFHYTNLQPLWWRENLAKRFQ